MVCTFDSTASKQSYKFRSSFLLALQSYSLSSQYASASSTISSMMSFDILIGVLMRYLIFYLIIIITRHILRYEYEKIPLDIFFYFFYFLFFTFKKVKNRIIEFIVILRSKKTTFLFFYFFVFFHFFDFFHFFQVFFFFYNIFSFRFFSLNLQYPTYRILLQKQSVP